MSDAPIALINLDALSRGLAAGCPNWIDVTGPTYAENRPSGKRIRDQQWQRVATHYLRSGNAVILMRGRASGFDARTRHAIKQDGVLDAAGGHRVYRITN
jgi:hypothetical protein